MYQDMRVEFDELINEHGLDEYKFKNEGKKIEERYKIKKQNLDEEYNDIEQRLNKLSGSQHKTTQFSGEYRTSNLPVASPMKQNLESKINVPKTEIHSNTTRNNRVTTIPKNSGVFIPNNGQTGHWERRNIKTKTGEIYEERVWVSNEALENIVYHPSLPNQNIQTQPPQTPQKQITSTKEKSQVKANEEKLRKINSRRR